MPGWLLPLLSLLFFCSGACALVYQVMWLRLLALVFGVTVYAASTVLAIAGSLLFFALNDRSIGPAESDDYAMATRFQRISPQETRDQALRSGQDPRLAGANIVIDAAHSELQAALEQHPDAVFLVSLLNRTNAQRMKIEQLGAKAG